MTLKHLTTDLFIARQKATPSQLILDFDPSDVKLHGQQENRFYHGYYGEYCYLPMYVFCGEFPLAIRLRPSNIDASLGTDEIFKKLVPKLRAAWPEVRIIIRGDSGFCREELMRWCEDNDVDYVFGIAKNTRLARWSESAFVEST